MSDAARNTVAEPPRPGTEGYGFTQHGRTGEIVRLAFVNALLNLVTLSFYRFWGKTRVRQYLWRSTQFMGEPLEYIGRGLELCLGFLMIFALVLLPLIGLNWAIQFYVPPDHPLFLLYSVAAYPVILFLIGQAIYRARRYRLSRTLWRGIRGAMTGSPHRYAFMYLGCFFLNALAGGLAYPWTRVRLFGRLMSQTAFGGTSFAFEGSSGRLYGRFLLCLLLALGGIVLIPIVCGLIVAAVAYFTGGFDWLTESFASLTPGREQEAEGSGAFPGQALFMFGLMVFIVPLGLWIAYVFALYKAHEFKTLAGFVSFEGLSFAFVAKTRDLFRLWFGNLLLVLLTLGLALPVAQLRTFRFFCTHLAVRGSADFDAIRQSSAALPGIGEGLADAFDMGAV